MILFGNMEPPPIYLHILYTYIYIYICINISYIYIYFLYIHIMFAVLGKKLQIKSHHCSHPSLILGFNNEEAKWNQMTSCHPPRRSGSSHPILQMCEIPLQSSANVSVESSVQPSQLWYSHHSRRWTCNETWDI